MAVYNDRSGSPGLTGEALATLRGRVRGAVLTSADPDYDTARRVWNGSIDRYPGAIVRAADTRDIRLVVGHARRNGLPLAIRGGGHDVAGNGTCDGGLVLDLGGLKGIRIDADAKTVRVQPGVVWGELDLALAHYSLALTGGQISSTGVAGLTLGGGLGWLMRERGLTVDSLLSVDLITAEGEALTVSERQNADLFWAIRGGGGNFGVVTAFEFRVQPLGEIVGGTVAHPASRAREVLEFFRHYVLDLPESLTPMAYFFTGPQLDALPLPLRGRSLASIAVCSTGDDSTALSHLRLLQFGPPIVDAIRPMPYTQLQSLFDAGSLPGFLNYWRSHYLQPLSTEAADTLADYVSRMASPLSIVLLTPMGGAVQRVASDATAFGHRDAPLVLEILAKWQAPDTGETHIAWANAFWEAMRPFSTGGVYVNFLGNEGLPRVRDAYSADGFARLTALKKRFDPDNFFRLNQNIPPAGGGELV